MTEKAFIPLVIVEFLHDFYHVSFL